VAALVTEKAHAETEVQRRDTALQARRSLAHSRAVSCANFIRVGLQWGPTYSWAWPSLVLWEDT
jgi:hypothetical protein